MEQRERKFDVNSALAEILGLEQTLYATGAVDAEAVDFGKIKEDLIAGVIVPSEAVERARAIIAARQDYH